MESSSGRLRTYFGNGAGGASKVVKDTSQDWNDNLRVLTAGAFDGDAMSDLMWVDSRGQLLLRPGAGDGLYGPSTVIGKRWDLADLVTPVGDFDGNGCGDLMVRIIDDPTLYLYRGDCRGGFLTRRSIGHGWDIVRSIVGLGDFTGDSNPDILYTTSNGELWLGPGNGSGGFSPRSASVRVGRSTTRCSGRAISTAMGATTSLP